MPRVSEFYGMVIATFYNDHVLSHFHVVHGQHRAGIGIDPVMVIEGFLPQRALSMIYEWAAGHQLELRENWQRAREHRPLSHIAPLG